MRQFNIQMIALLTCTLLAFTTQAQNLKADFNALPLTMFGYYNGSDGVGGFSNGGLFFKNNYTPQFMSWTGWAYSALFDTVTAGFTNQYSCAAGVGATVIPEERFALAYVLDAAIIRRTDLAPFSPRSVLFSNNTFAYLSMKNGDQFAKKFGGPTGNDPDFFQIIIRGFRNGQPVDTTSFYLADFRFNDNTQDYILKNWTPFTFPPNFQSALFDSLAFEMASSDVGQFGINTPTYFCMDEFEYSLSPTSIKATHENQTRVFPNPAKERLFVLTNLTLPQITVSIQDVQGKLVHKMVVNELNGTLEIPVAHLKSGLYLLHITSEKGVETHKIIKQ
jgi:hypothetical protein